MKSTNLNGKTIFYEEIILKEYFSRLYIEEKPIQSCNSIVTTNTDRPYFFFNSNYRKLLNFRVGDLILIRVKNHDKEVQYISKIYKWGKIHLPKQYVKLLGLNNKQEINWQIFARDEILKRNIENQAIDLANLGDNSIKIIPRTSNLITVYSKRNIVITLPRYVNISQNLFELFFLVHGDGHYKTKLFFVNKSPELINFVMSCFKANLGVSNEEWMAKLLISDNRNAIHSREYWKNITKLKECQFYNNSRSFLNTNIHGNLRIIIGKSIVAHLFRLVFEILKKNLTPANSLYALNGLLCAEGSASIEKKGLHKITLSFNLVEKPLFLDVLTKAGLSDICKTSENRMFVIENWANLYIFFDKFFSKNVVPFSYHIQRRNNAINGFLNHQHTKTLEKYLLVLNCHNSLTTAQFSSILGVRRDSVLDFARNPRYIKFISLKGDRNSYILSITTQGLNFLEIIGKMQTFRREYMQENLLPFEESERKVIIRKESGTNPEFGCIPEQRKIENLIQSGVITLNKPSGPTSHQAADYVKKILHLDKVGHGGTLAE